MADLAAEAQDNPVQVAPDDLSGVPATAEHQQKSAQVHPDPDTVVAATAATRGAPVQAVTHPDVAPFAAHQGAALQARIYSSYLQASPSQQSAPVQAAPRQGGKMSMPNTILSNRVPNIKVLPSSAKVKPS